MTGTEPAWADRSALLSYSNKLAELRLWSDSARFGELAVSPDDPDVGARLEVAWRLLLAGRHRAAADRLADLPDYAHPELATMRLAADGLSTPNPAPDTLHGFLAAVGRQAPTAVSLRLVVLVALAVGDDRTALDAASRYLAVADDPEMRRLMARRQAIAGELGAAIESAEHAAGSRLVDQGEPIREVVDELDSDGHPHTALRFLAEGYLATGRAVYGELLTARLSRRVRSRNRAFWYGVAAVFLGVGVMTSESRQLLPLGSLFVVGGFVAWIVSIFVRVPGTTREETNQLTTAHGQYRWQHGPRDLPAIAVGWGVGTFTVGMGAMAAMGAAGEVPVSTVLLMLGLGVVFGAVAGVLARSPRRRARGQPLALEAGEQVDPGRCHCWETDLIAGTRWRVYLGEHLDRVSIHPSLDAALLNCRTTEKYWLYLAQHRVAIAVPSPDGPEAANPSELGYL